MLTRTINQIFTADFGESWDNRRLLAEYEPIIEELPLDDAGRGELREFVRFQLVGERARRSTIDDWKALHGFESRAAAYEKSANAGLDALAAEIAPEAESAGISFDAIISTTATGNLMPGLSYRMAHRLGGLARPDSLMLDLGNVGCTGSSKALNLTRALDSSFRNVLVVAIEAPSTLIDTRGTALDLWQGNCTFGDGAAGLWISTDPDLGPTALSIEDMRYQQRSDAGLDLIRWCYRDYYAFALADHRTFDRDVRQFVVDALSETEAHWKEEPRWAIHPAGIALLVRISRKLGIPSEAIEPSIAEYRKHSNMSSVSLIHVLKNVAEAAPEGAAVNTLTMGAGFNVIYGRMRKLR